MAWIAIVAPVLLLTLGVGLRRRCARYIADTCTPGHVGPASTPLARAVSRVVCRFLVSVLVGGVKVDGRHHLPADDTACIIAGNHTHYADGVVLAYVLGLPARTRYFVARGALRFAFGLGALILGPAGSVAVDLRPGRATRELKAGVRLLAAGERLVLFPEGWAHMDGRRGRFKRGAIYLARRAEATCGRPIPIVPVYLNYPRHPGTWITRLSPWQQYLVAALNPWRYRRGVTIVIGPPIQPAAFADDIDEATGQLEERIYELAPRADKRTVRALAGMVSP